MNRVRPDHAPGRWAAPLLWTVTVVLSLRLAVLAVAGLDRHSHGFVSHYTAARAVLEGGDVSRFYDEAWFSEQVRRFEPAVVDVYSANLPTMGLLLLPLAPLDYPTARAIWTLGSLVGLLAILAFLCWRLELRGPWAPLFVGFGVAAQPVQENLLRGQMYVFVLAVLCLAWDGFRRGRELRTGGAMGAILVTKTAASVVWPLFVARRMWKTLLSGAVLFVAVAAGSLPWIGIEAWTAYGAAASALTEDPLLGVTAYQTQFGFFRHLFDQAPGVSPAPLLDLPVLGRTLHWLLAGGLLGTGLWVAVRSESDDMVFAGFVLLTLILSPVSLDYHYVLVLLPVAVLLEGIRGRPGTLAVAGFVLGSVLVAADLPYRADALKAGWLSLLAYPKLYGAGLLWLVSVAASVGRGSGARMEVGFDPRSGAALPGRAEGRALP